MNLYKLYAVCINNSKIQITSEKTINNFDCEVYNTMEEANKKINDKAPLDFKIIELYSPKPQSFYKTYINIHVTYTI